MKKIYRVQITHIDGGACVWDAEHAARIPSEAIREAYRRAKISKDDRWEFEAHADRVD